MAALAQDPLETIGAVATADAAGPFVTGMGALALALGGIGVALFHNHDVVSKIFRILIGVGVAVAAVGLVTWAGSIL